MKANAHHVGLCVHAAFAFHFHNISDYHQSCGGAAFCCPMLKQASTNRCNFPQSPRLSAAGTVRKLQGMMFFS